MYIIREVSQLQEAETPLFFYLLSYNPWLIPYYSRIKGGIQKKRLGSGSYRIILKYTLYVNELLRQITFICMCRIQFDFFGYLLCCKIFMNNVA